MALFRKDKTPKPDDAGVAPRDADKGRAWFDQAAKVADTRQYDYAIECYISGLKHDPGNRAMHEALRDVSLKRKVGGGKPAGIAKRLNKKPSEPVDRFIHCEELWAMDPLSLPAMLQTMKAAVAADESAPDYGLSEMAYWIGQMILENSQTSKKPDKTAYLELRDLLTQIEAYDMAVHACHLAIQADPKDTDLLNELKDLEAESTLKRGGYSGQEGGFREAVLDMARQNELSQDDAITKTESVVSQIIERRRAEYGDDPDDLDRLQKLVDALLQNEDDKTENEAIELMQRAFEQTKQYRFRMRIGDVRMNQMTRKHRRLRAEVEADAQDAEARSRLEHHYRKRMKFELEEYTERVKNYPTDLGMTFQFGVRLYAFKKYDDAIGAFQQAKSDPKHRAASHDYLGRCYLARDWFDEAVDTFREGIKLHPLNDDRLGKELRYQLMAALENAARKNNSLEQAREAQKIASQLLQTDIKFRDIRERIDTIRACVEELQKKPETSG